MSVFKMIRPVAMREITTRGRSNTYRITTVALAVLAVGSILFQRHSGDWFEHGPRQVAVVPATADLEASLDANASLIDLDVEILSFDGREAALAALEEGDVDAVVLTPSEAMFREASDPALTALVARAVYEITLSERAASVGLTVEQARALVTPPVVEESILRADIQDDREAAAGIAYLTSVILFIAISLYGQWVLVGVVEEKANRVVEVLLAVVAPWQLLAGKVIGIILLAVGQVVIVGLAFVAALFALGEAELPRVTAESLAIGVAWLVIGVVLYNFVYAAVGATITRAEEASSAATPVMMPLLAGYLVSLIYVPLQPDSMISRVLSLFPLTAPFSMPARFAAGGVAWWEMALAFALALAGIGAIVWFAGRIYSGAILQAQRIGLLAAFRRRRELG